MEGYESRNKLETCEKEALPLMMQCIELLFVAYWQQQGNRKAAEEAADMFRFVGRLGFTF